MNKFDITGCLVIRNEESYIENCLKWHQPYLQHIVIIDEGSTDKTKEILSEFDIYKLIEREDNSKFAENQAGERNLLHEIAPTEWVLHIDADELFDVNFLNNMKELIWKGNQQEPLLDAFRFPRINLPDRYNYPDYQVRLLRKSVCYWKGYVHNRVYDKRTDKLIDQGNSINSCSTYPILHLQKPMARKIFNLNIFTQRHVKEIRGELDKPYSEIDWEIVNNRLNEISNDVRAATRGFI